MNRPKSNAQTEREAPEGFVVEKFEPHKGRYGHRRINRRLRRDGTVVSERRVLAVMRRPGPQAKGTTRRHRRAKPVEEGGPRANPIDRAFDAGARNRLWVGDITYIDTDEGRPCLAAVTGARHRKAAGRSMSDGVTEEPAVDAPGQAVGREGPPDGFSPASRDDRGPNTPRAHSRDASSRTGQPGQCQGLEIRGTMRWPSRSSRRSSES